MKASLGGGMLLYLVVFFLAFVMLTFVSILSYSKAYRVKNRIIELVEKYEVYESISGKVDAVDAIKPDLSNAGYDVSNPTRCNSNNVQNHLKEILPEKYHTKLPRNINKYGYNYCVFEINSDEYPEKISNGKFYVVVTFVKYEFPIIGDLLTFPVYGETKILKKSYNYD